MKKLLLILVSMMIVLSLSFSLVACSEEEQPSGEETTSSSQSVSESKSEAQQSSAGNGGQQSSDQGGQSSEDNGGQQGGQDEDPTEPGEEGNDPFVVPAEITGKVATFVYSLLNNSYDIEVNDDVAALSYKNGECTFEGAPYGATQEEIEMALAYLDEARAFYAAYATMLNGWDFEVEAGLEVFFDRTELATGARYTLNMDKVATLVHNILLGKSVKGNIEYYFGEGAYDYALANIKALLNTTVGDLLTGAYQQFGIGPEVIDEVQAFVGQGFDVKAFLAAYMNKPLYEAIAGAMGAQQIITDADSIISMLDTFANMTVVEIIGNFYEELPEEVLYPVMYLLPGQENTTAAQIKEALLNMCDLELTIEVGSNGALESLVLTVNGADQQGQPTVVFSLNIRAAA